MPLRHLPAADGDAGRAPRADRRRADRDGTGANGHALRERWFGATGRKVPQIAIEGELDLDGALVLDAVDDAALRAAFDEGRPIVVRAASADDVVAALKRPEVSSVLVPREQRQLVDLDLIKLTYGTYSIAACDLETGQWGVATQSKFLAVGSVVPWAEPHVGAIATQAYANPRYGADGLALLRDGGLSAEAVGERVTSADEGREHRQLGVVDSQGRAASFTGSECNEWAGGRTGDGYAAQGNILVSAETVDAIADTFESTSGSLAARLIECLAAAQAAGGDSRGQQSAALLVVEKDGGYAGLSDVVVDLRVDDHERPVEELRRLYGLHQAIFGQTPREEWVAVDEQLGDELRERL